MSDIKTCTKCGIKKDVSEFSKHKLSRDGLTSQCKLCRNAAKAIWNKNNRVRVAEYNKTYQSKNTEKQKQWKENNRERINELERARYHADKEKFIQKRKEQYQKHAEKRRAYQSERKKQMPWLNAFHRATEKARELGVIPSWADFEAMKRIYKRKFKMEKEIGVALHVDHIIPLKSELVSGLHCEANLQILTASANARKNNKLVEV